VLAKDETDKKFAFKVQISEADKHLLNDIASFVFNKTIIYT